VGLHPTHGPDDVRLVNNNTMGHWTFRLSNAPISLSGFDVGSMWILVSSYGLDVSPVRPLGFNLNPLYQPCGLIIRSPLGVMTKMKPS
jgi:hypothetical protein